MTGDTRTFTCYTSATEACSIAIVKPTLLPLSITFYD
jgi:hypothetical protein